MTYDAHRWVATALCFRVACPSVRAEPGWRHSPTGLPSTSSLFFLIFVLLAEHSNYVIPLCDTMLSFVDCVTRLVFLSGHMSYCQQRQCMSINGNNVTLSLWRIVTSLLSNAASMALTAHAQLPDFRHAWHPAAGKSKIMGYIDGQIVAG